MIDIEFWFCFRFAWVFGVFGEGSGVCGEEG